MLSSLFVFRIITLIILSIGIFYSKILGSLLILSFILFSNTWAYIFNLKYYSKNIESKLKIKFFLSCIYIALSIMLIYEFSLKTIHILYMIFILVDILFLHVNVYYVNLSISKKTLNSEIQKLEEESNEPVMNLLEAFNFRSSKSNAYMILGYSIIGLVISDIAVFVLSILVKNSKINYVLVIFPAILFIIFQEKMLERLSNFNIGLQVSKLMKNLLYIKTLLILVHNLYHGGYFEQVRIISTLLLMVCYFTFYLFFVFASKDITKNKESMS